LEKQIDYDGDKPHTTAFDQAGMAVFVEGPGFPALDLSLSFLLSMHDNHAIVICKKNVTKGMKMKLASQWGLKPPAK